MMSHSTYIFLISSALLLSGRLGYAQSVTGQHETPTIGARVSLPDMPTVAMGRSTLPLNASEAAYHVDEAEVRRGLEVSVTVKYPLDSIRAATTHAGQTWLRRLPADISGIQQDPAIQVMVAAGEIDRANAVIAARMATPGLSFVDKALTYRTAVVAFARQALPDRVSIAEQYLAKLDALGDSAASWRYQARAMLIHAYFLLGRSADIRRLGTGMIALAPHVAFNDRKVVFDGGIQAYDEYVIALSEEPDAAQRIAAANTALEAAAKAPADWVAQDPAFEQTGRLYQARLKYRIVANAMLGTPATPLVAHVWLNRLTSDSTLAVNDGKIRVIELANTSCAGCMSALQMIERLHRQYPAIETVFLTYTYGNWGNRFVTADEEVPHLVEFLNQRAKITMPAGIWKSRLIPNEDDGFSIESRGPNWDHYPTAKMSVWVIDGRGIIRRTFSENFSRDSEAELGRTVEFLMREAVQRASVATLPGSHE